MEQRSRYTEWWSCWGVNGERSLWNDAERALLETSQKTDESNDSYLARSDVLWSRLLARKMSLEDLQAYIVLRGSLLTSEEKKVILDSEVDGKLTGKRVTQAIRTLGASFFMDMTNQKKHSRTKIYDQTALHNETAGESEESEMAYYAQDEITEEKFIEQLMEQGDADALLVGDFELAAQDTIQEDQSLAVALTTYQQARHRLSERFCNRVFFQTSHSQDSQTGSHLVRDSTRVRDSPTGTAVQRNSSKSASCRAHAESVAKEVTGVLSALSGITNSQVDRHRRVSVETLHPLLL